LANHGVGPTRILETTRAATHEVIHTLSSRRAALAVVGRREVQIFVVVGGDFTLSHADLACDIPPHIHFTQGCVSIIRVVVTGTIKRTLTIHRILETLEMVLREPWVAWTGVRETHERRHCNINI